MGTTGDRRWTARELIDLVLTRRDAFEDANNHAMDVVCGLVDLNFGFDAKPVRLVRS